MTYSSPPNTTIPEQEEVADIIIFVVTQVCDKTYACSTANPSISLYYLHRHSKVKVKKEPVTKREKGSSKKKSKTKTITKPEPKVKTEKKPVIKKEPVIKKVKQVCVRACNNDTKEHPIRP